MLHRHRVLNTKAAVLEASEKWRALVFILEKIWGACGEAGGITTNSKVYTSHLQSLRNHGSVTRYYHDELGFNMRMGGLEGGSLSVKLKYLSGWNDNRRKIAKRYQSEIKNPSIKMQAQPNECNSIYHLFVVTTENREKLTKHLNDKDIYPGLHYPVPCHLQKAYSHLNYKIGDFPMSEYLAGHCLSLPMYSELTDEQVTYVIKPSMITSRLKKKIFEAIDRLSLDLTGKVVLTEAQQGLMSSRQLSQRWQVQRFLLLPEPLATVRKKK